MSSSATSSPGPSACRDSITLEFPVLVKRLRALLGGRLVAYLGGVKEARVVHQWAAGKLVPSDAVAQRLRLAYQVAGLITESQYSPAVVQAWFQEANPRLKDHSPARALREEDPHAVGPQVLSAAQAFARLG